MPFRQVTRVSTSIRNSGPRSSSRLATAIGTIGFAILRGQPAPGDANHKPMAPRSARRAAERGPTSRRTPGTRPAPARHLPASSASPSPSEDASAPPPVRARPRPPRTCARRQVRPHLTERNPQRPPRAATLRARTGVPPPRAASPPPPCPCLLPAVPGAVGGAVPGARLPSGSFGDRRRPPPALPAAHPSYPARRRPRRSPRPRPGSAAPSGSSGSAAASGAPARDSARRPHRLRLPGNVSPPPPCTWERALRQRRRKMPARRAKCVAAPRRPFPPSSRQRSAALRNWRKGSRPGLADFLPAAATPCVACVILPVPWGERSLQLGRLPRMCGWGAARPAPKNVTYVKPLKAVGVLTDSP